MENNKKHIAAIFEEQKVFMTFSGNCYQYTEEQGAFRCHKMNKLSQKMFWDNYRQQVIAKQKSMTSWQPVAAQFDYQRIEHSVDRQVVSEPMNSEMVLRFQALKRLMNLDK